MKHKTSDYEVVCGCRSVGECQHGRFAWKHALDSAVDDFAAQMKKKLLNKTLEGKSGWDDPDWSREHIIECLKEHVEKGDMVDVANFAMFAWNQE